MIVGCLSTPMSMRRGAPPYDATKNVACALGERVVHVDHRHRMPSSIGTHLFTDAKPDPALEEELRKFGGNPFDPLTLLRDVDRNVDVWDTLTPAVVNMMMNPPAEYDAKYQKRVNVAVLTALAALTRS